MGMYQQEYVLVMGMYLQEYIPIMGTYMLPLYELLKHLGLPIGVQLACYRHTIGLLPAYGWPAIGVGSAFSVRCL